MNITTGATLLFCEGLPRSLDRLMLTNLPDMNVEVVPTGGKKGMPAFVEGAVYGRTDNPRYVLFRDRDLDAEPPPQPHLIRLEASKPLYAGHRSCIESYFLSGAMMVEYWNEVLVKWGVCPLDAAGFDSVIEDAARQLADYQAVRWGLRKLRQMHAANDLPDKLGESSGQLPPDLAYASCLTDALSILGGYRENAGARTPESLKQYAEEYRMRFADAQFFAAKAYLAWFHGKDLTTAFNTALATQRPTLNFPTGHYMNWAAEQMGQRWYNQFPDLVELIQLVS